MGRTKELLEDLTSLEVQFSNLADQHKRLREAFKESMLRMQELHSQLIDGGFAPDSPLPLGFNNLIENLKNEVQNDAINKK